MPPAPDRRPPHAARRDVSGEPWRFARLLEAPHRLAFFTGAAMLAATAIWWLIALADGIAGGASIPWVVAPRHAHALLMSFSYMPMFFAGFLCTAGPRWLALPGIDARVLVPMVVLWLTGWTAFVAGVHLHAPTAAIGLAVVAAAWSAFCGRLFGWLRASEAADLTHLRVIAGACALGAAALWTAATAIALDDPEMLHFSVLPALWWFLAPVFAAAVHRMVPFLGIAAPALEQRYPNWLLSTWLICMAVQPLLAWRIGEGGTFAWAGGLANAAAATLVAWLLVVWRARQNLRLRLLAMLFLACAWLGIAFALQAANAALIGAGATTTDLRLAGVHALTMGFFGSAMLAMVSRITCGQGGRIFNAERLVWFLFLGLQLATVLRIVSVVRPDWPTPLLGAAFAWALVMVVWSVRYIGWYGRPRADGRPG